MKSATCRLTRRGYELRMVDGDHRRHTADSCLRDVALRVASFGFGESVSLSGPAADAVEGELERLGPLYVCEECGEIFVGDIAYEKHLPCPGEGL